jgi:DNA-binding protein YbaB
MSTSSPFDGISAMLSSLAGAGLPGMGSDVEVEGESGQGAVRVRLSARRCRSVSIDPERCDLSDRTLLEDLVVAAIDDALGRLGQAERARLEDLGSQLAGFLGGVAGAGLGGLGDLSSMLGGLGRPSAGDEGGPSAAGSSQPGSTGGAGVDEATSIPDTPGDAESQ